MEVLVLGGFEDLQTGIYICRSFYDLGHGVEAIDTRKFFSELGATNSQTRIKEEIEDYSKNITPELIIVMKGLELHLDTLNFLREKFPKATIVNWFFDVFLTDKPIWEEKKYFETIKFYDFYFCSAKGVADKLNEAGFKNARYLDEGCYPPMNGEVPMNWFQEKKYGEDISFIGSLGFLKQHSTRARVLKKIVEEGFNLNIWGPVVTNWKDIGYELRNYHKGTPVINNEHSLTCQASLINLGIDQNREIEMGHSARIFRVMCAGGFYMLNATKGIDKIFTVNKDGAEITGEEDLVLYYSETDLINKLDFLLEHDEIRNKIAKNGQKKVLENHTFCDRIKEMIKIMGEKIGKT